MARQIPDWANQLVRNIEQQKVQILAEKQKEYAQAKAFLAKQDKRPGKSFDKDQDREISL